MAPWCVDFQGEDKPPLPPPDSGSALPLLSPFTSVDGFSSLWFGCSLAGCHAELPKLEWAGRSRRPGSDDEGVEGAGRLTKHRRDEQKEREGEKEQEGESLKGTEMSRSLGRRRTTNISSLCFLGNFVRCTRGWVGGFQSEWWRFHFLSPDKTFCFIKLCLLLSCCQKKKGTTHLKSPSSSHRKLYLTLTCKHTPVAEDSPGVMDRCISVVWGGPCSRCLHWVLRLIEGGGEGCPPTFSAPRTWLAPGSHWQNRHRPPLPIQTKTTE